MATKKTFTKRPKVLSGSVRLDRFDRDRAVEAAARMGVSMSELIRSSVRKEAEAILNQPVGDRKAS